MHASMVGVIIIIIDWRVSTRLDLYRRKTQFGYLRKNCLITVLKITTKEGVLKLKVETGDG